MTSKVVYYLLSVIYPFSASNLTQYIINCAVFKDKGTGKLDIHIIIANDSLFFRLFNGYNYLNINLYNLVKKV